MLSSSSELPKPSPQIKQDGKFYSRLLSKETSLTSPSLRVYYGVASGAVPFLWESQPGTPKDTISITDLLPPLTPPPSYHYSTKNKNSNRPHKSNLIRAILPKLSLQKKSHKLPSSSSMSFSSSSVSSSSSSVSSSHQSRPSSSRLSFSSTGDDKESSGGSPTSTLCFGMRHRAADAGPGPSGCFSSVL